MGLSYNPSSVSDGIVLYLDAANPRSYAGTGTTWYDISGNSNNATFVDSPTYLSVPQPYFNFDGSNDYMRIVRSPSMSPTSGLTQEVWFNFTSIPNAVVFIGLQYGASFQNSYALFKESSLLYGGVNTSGSLSSIGIGTTNLVGNRWYHFVHTYDGSTQKLYLNGVLMTTGSQSGSIQYDVNNTRVLIGADDNSGYNAGAGAFHSGKISQVRIYNRGLSATEVLRNYNAQRKRYFQEENIVTNGLVLHVDASNSNSYPGTGTSWYDLSGNQNHARMVTYGNSLPVFQNNGFYFNGSISKALFLCSTSTNLTNKKELSVYVWCKTINGTGRQYAVDTRGAGSYGTGVGVGFDNNGPYKTFNFVDAVVGYDESASPTTFQNNIVYQLGISRSYSGTGISVLDTDSVTKISPTLNGNSLTTADINLGPYTIGATSGLLSGSDNYWWKGEIYIVMLYDRELSQAEITQNYNALRGRFGL